MSSNSVLILIVLYILANVQGLNITVFYETFCPYSKNFISKHLMPVYLEFYDHINLEMVPYGNAKHSMNPWDVKCQHGPAECYGNTVQACFLNQHTTLESVHFIECYMNQVTRRTIRTTGPMCAEEFGLSYDKVDDCVNGKEGRELTAKYGDRTHRFTHPINHVPTIVFDNVFDQAVQDGKNFHLAYMVCKRLQDLNTNCEKYIRRNYYRWLRAVTAHN